MQDLVISVKTQITKVNFPTKLHGDIQAQKGTSGAQKEVPASPSTAWCDNPSLQQLADLCP